MESSNLILNKKGQAWSVDLVVAMIVFSIGIIAFFIYSVNYSKNFDDDYKILAYEGKIVSENILSEGHPVEWTPENVTRIGILTQNKIDQNKLEKFYNLVQTNYTTTKKLLNTRYNYYFLVDGNITIDSEETEGFGKPDADPRNINAKNLIKITRVSIYENKPVLVHIYIWE